MDTAIRYSNVSLNSFLTRCSNHRHVSTSPTLLEMVTSGKVLTSPNQYCHPLTTFCLCIRDQVIMQQQTTKHKPFCLVACPWRHSSQHSHLPDHGWEFSSRRWSAGLAVRYCNQKWHVEIYLLCITPWASHHWASISSFWPSMYVADVIPTALSSGLQFSEPLKYVYKVIDRRLLKQTYSRPQISW